MSEIIVIKDSSTDLEKEWVILTSFESEIYKHEYLVVYDETNIDENGDVELEILIYEDENLFYIEDDDEYDHAQQLLEEFFKQQDISEQ